MEEKLRREPRFIAHFDGFYRLRGSHEWYECYIFDISDSGASIRLNQTLIINDHIEICLDKERISHIISATVANVVGQAVGVKFNSHDADEIISLAMKKAFENTRHKA